MKLLFKKGGTLSRSLPVFVWLAALVGVGYLLFHQSERAELQGIAFSHEQTINSVETGYIRSIPVSLYQTVKKGDTLAVIKENTVAREEYEYALLAAQRATAEAALGQLKAQLQAAEDTLLAEQFDRENDVLAMQRRLAVDVERARLEVLEIRSELEPDRLALKDLAVEIDIITRLLEQGAAQEYELQKIHTTYAIKNEQVTQTEALLTQAQADYEAAILRKDEFVHKLPLRPLAMDKELAPVRQAILVQEKRIAELIERRDIIVLTAPFDGIVNALYYKPGQTVVRGDAIMTVVKPTPESITAWVPQQNLGRFDVNTKVKIISQNSTSETFVSQVSHVSSSLELMPERLWKSPTMPEWGRAIQIPIQPNFFCLHNEIVGIQTIVQ